MSKGCYLFPKTKCGILACYAVPNTGRVECEGSMVKKFKNIK